MSREVYSLLNADPLLRDFDYRPGIELNKYTYERTQSSIISLKPCNRRVYYDIAATLINEDINLKNQSSDGEYNINL